MIYGFLAGKNAKYVYEKYCRIFDWEYMYRGSFSQRQRLYACNATPEGLSVSMPVHTNLCEPYNREHAWFNIVSGDRITEVWFEEDNELLNDNSRRVCFIKTKEGYKFYGVYEVEKPGHYAEIYGKKELVRIFRRVSICYPMDKSIEEKTNHKYSSNSDDGEYVETTIVLEGCKIEAYVLGENKTIEVYFDKVNPMYRKQLLCKKKGDIYSIAGKSYRIDKILIK